MNNEKKTPKELIKKYFQEHSAEEERKLLYEINEKYKGSMTLKEFRYIYPDNNPKGASETKLEWKHLDNDEVARARWENCDYIFSIYKIYSDVYSTTKIRYLLRVQTITPNTWTTSTNSQIEVEIRTFVCKSIKKAKAKAQAIVEVLELS